MVELLPRATSFGRKDGNPANKEDPASKRPLLDKDKDVGKNKKSAPKESYRVNNEWAYRDYREFGYGKVKKLPTKTQNGL